MPTLLVVDHVVSPATAELHAAVVEALAVDDLAGVDVVARPALAAGAADVLAADAVLLGTPATIGYLSGALKHFFDTAYYPCLGHTDGLPWAAWVHGSGDAEGAVRALGTITTGLRWRAVAPPVVVLGAVGREQREAVAEAAQVLAAGLL